jgi:DNA-binding MarR family transcriptional regulator
MTQGEALSILATGANVFLTGEPGSGKTHTVNAYVAWLRARGIEPSITASTGIAATHIHGMTIHAWSGIGIREYLSPQDLDAIASKEHVVRRIQKTQVLIIDEISMLSAGVLDMVDQVAREIRHSDHAFGGMQVVLVGDFFQLPPITKGGREAQFAFESPVWKQLNPIICYLTEQYRQDDPQFLSVLSSIRDASWDVSDVSRITARQTDGDDIEDEVPRLYTHNEDVDRLNEAQLAALPGAEKVFHMDSSGAPLLIESLKRGCLSPVRLVLKENALVMCTKNNPAAGYANGTLGKVISFEKGSNNPIIETRSGEMITIQPLDWAVEEQGKIRAKIMQIPLRLAWAITIHKSQGMSMDAAAMDLSRSFEYGQGYVALSRVRRLSGVHLLGWSENALRVHPKVQSADAAFRDASAMAAVAFGALEETGERTAMEEQFIKASGGSIDAAPEGERLEKAPKASTYDLTLSLLQEGKTIEEIAETRSLTQGTIADHLEKLASSGRISSVDIENALPKDLADALPEIAKAFKKHGKDKLTPVFMMLKRKYTYDELKLARLLLRE